MNLTPVPMTRDGVEFKLGMTLWTEVGGSFKTSPETHEVVTLEHAGVRFSALQRRGTSVGTDTRMFFTSNFARLHWLIGLKENERAEIDAEIDELKRELRSLRA